MISQVGHSDAICPMFKGNIWATAVKMLHVIEFAKEAQEEVEIAGGDKNWDRSIMSLTQGYNLFVRMLKLQERTDMWTLLLVISMKSIRHVVYSYFDIFCICFERYCEEVKIAGGRGEKRTLPIISLENRWLVGCLKVFMFRIYKSHKKLKLQKGGRGWGWDGGMEMESGQYYL